MCIPPMMTAMALLGAVTMTLIVGAVTSAAGYGVATNTARIVLEEPLIRGESYDLPQIAVINSGDGRGIYEVRIGYRTGQREIKPPAEWFTFNPQTMTLEPDEHQLVSISLTIPAEAETGAYFAYVESRLAYALVDGESVPMGISVGTELPFQVISPTVTSTPTPTPTSTPTSTPSITGTPTSTGNLIPSPTPVSDDSDTVRNAYLLGAIAALVFVGAVGAVWIWLRRKL